MSVLRSIYTHKPIIDEKRMILPLLRDERPIGALYLLAEERGIRPHKLEFVLRVADNVAIAVENARLYEALRQANHAKSEFVSIVSHELRAPMTSLKGYADMLKNGKLGTLSAQQQEFLDAIRRNTQRMELLISDLTDISRIETGQLSISPRPIVFSEALDEAVETVRDLAEAKQQVLTLNVWNGLPNAHADKARLTQALINLLSNAIKYSPYQGSIAVRVWLSPEEPDFIRCAITDSGVGISPQDQTQLFTKFFRANDPQCASSQERAGTRHHQEPDRNARRPHLGRKRRGQRQHLLLYGSHRHAGLKRRSNFVDNIGSGQPDVGILLSFPPSRLVRVAGGGYFFPRDNSLPGHHLRTAPPWPRPRRCARR
jgi:K+-sensing histidine kinase KdpD